ncbi:MAG: radical SAM protein [Ruminococcus sp.]|nr:radical SAM protein [Ruminococcus sp.]
MTYFNMTNRHLCPRRCGADRTKSLGQCHCGDKVYVTRTALHFWEEPCISGKNGSGTVFFSGCALGRMFCQNHEINQKAVGKHLTIKQLVNTFLNLQQQNASNINLVTGSHFSPWIAEALSLIKSKLHIPVVWNSSGYDSPEILQMLDGLIDIYLPDLKFSDSKIGMTYANCADYFPVASAAINEMFRQVGSLQWNGDLLQRGLVVRHLVLPGHRKESMAILDWLSQSLPQEQFLLSLMGQYTPTETAKQDKYLRRRITTLEYESIRKYAVSLNFNGFSQERSSANEAFLPEFFTSIE